MPQSRNDHPDHRHLDIRPRLIEHEKIETGAPGDIDAGKYLLAGIVETAELQAGARLARRLAAWRQKRMVRKMQRRDAVEARFLAGAAAHQTDGKELVQFRQGTQQGNAAIEVRARTEFDVFLPVLYPVQYRNIGRNAEIAGDVE